MKNYKLKSIDARKKVLFITRNFPPLVGGMERLLHHIYLELSREFDVAVVGPAGCKAYLQQGPPSSECRLSPLPMFLACLQWRAFLAAMQYRPDLILAGSGVATPAATLAGWVTGAPVVCYLHGLDLVAQSRLYRMVFIPAIRRCNTFIVNSHNTAGLVKKNGIDESAIRVLHPGVSIPEEDEGPAMGSFRELVPRDDGKILLSVGRLSQRKGLADFIAKVLPRILIRNRRTKLVIIGSEPQHALKRIEGVEQEIRAAVEAVGASEHVYFLGNVDEATLHAAYWESDLFVFPVIDRPGDVEGFGMVAIEAAAHGLPTVAFKVGGVADAVKDGYSGYLLDPGDYDGFYRTILHHLESADTKSWATRCKQYAEGFSWDRFGEKLREIISQTCST